MQFAPTYHDYVLYNHSSDSGEENGGTKYRARTFVPTGSEMDTIRKSKDLPGGKLSDIQLSVSSMSNSNSGHTTPEIGSPTKEKVPTPSSSLLVDVSESPSIIPFDLSLVDIDMSGYADEVPAVKTPETR